MDLTPSQKWSEHIEQLFTLVTDIYEGQQWKFTPYLLDIMKW